MKVTWSRVINPDWSLSDEDRTLAKWSLVLSATSNVPSTGPNSMVRDNRRSELRYLSMWWSALTVHRPLHLIRHESKPGNNESHIFDPSELFSARPPLPSSLRHNLLRPQSYQRGAIETKLTKQSFSRSCTSSDGSNYPDRLTMGCCCLLYWRL